MFKSAYISDASLSDQFIRTEAWLRNLNVPWSTIVALLAVVGAASFVSADALAALPIFFILQDEGASGCGCDAGDSSSSSSDDGGADGGTGTTTPYLYLKTRDGFMMLNDVMVGLPTTYVMTREEGELRRQGNMLGADHYPFALSDEHTTATTLELKLKEIEPEESYIHQLQGHFYTIPAGHSLLQGWNHTELFSADLKTAVVPPQVFLNGGRDCASDFQGQTYDSHQEEKQHSLRLQRGDKLRFTVDRSVGQTLLVSSFWRDWMAGDDLAGAVVAAQRSAAKSVHRMLGRIVARGFVLVTVVLGLFGGTAATSQPSDNKDSNDNKDKELLSLLKNCNQINIARAETTCGTTDGTNTGSEASFNVSFRHPQLGLWVHAGTVQPRAYRPTDVAVALPDEAFAEDGTADVQVEATKSHYLKRLAVLKQATAVTPAKTVALSMQHRRGGEVLNADVTPTTDSPLHMVAGDELSIRAEGMAPEYTHMAVELRGFYMPLTAEGRQIAGDWESKLDPTEREVIASVYG